jgi:NAD(P)-dependent dehydrogenase (short-subunit alcohol dehydrogenase family)
LITGGTSGLGRALAIELASLGAHVAVVARNEDRLKALSIEHPAIEWIQGDVSSKEDIYRISGDTLSRLGGLDVLINNASYLGETPLNLLLDTSCEDFEQVLQTNVLGPFRLTGALLPSMILQNSGLVVNISSDAAVNPYPRWGAYGASKASLAHLSRVWGEETGAYGIRFLALDPGDMDTPMHAAAIPDADPSTLLKPRDAALALLERMKS